MEFSYRTMAARILGLAETAIDPDEKEVEMAIKKRLTKKELKALLALENDRSEEEMCAILKVDEERLAKLVEDAKEKFRHPKLRNLIVMGQGEPDA